MAGYSLRIRIKWENSLGCCQPELLTPAAQIHYVHGVRPAEWNA